MQQQEREQELLNKFVKLKVSKDLFKKYNIIETGKNSCEELINKTSGNDRKIAELYEDYKIITPKYKLFSWFIYKDNESILKKLIKNLDINSKTKDNRKIKIAAAIALGLGVSKLAFDKFIKKKFSKSSFFKPKPVKSKSNSKSEVKTNSKPKPEVKTNSKSNSKPKPEVKPKSKSKNK